MNNTVPRINGETYFFRDHGQFDLLRLRLLPELIEHRRNTKKLRIWSAGCASGEEAYSLAMLVDLLLPDRGDWDILVLGSDIDQTALAKARRGRYGQWSFRMAPPALQQRYFKRMGDEWVLDERILRMVTFRTIDLIRDAYSDSGLRDMDLILCRNVFIYFDADAIAAVAEKQAATLGEGGYLMAGHTELIGLHGNNLQSRLFAEGVVYQRATPAFTEAPPRPPTLIAETPAPIAPSPPWPVRAPSSSPSPAPGAEDLLTAAHRYADQGEYDRAEQTCLQSLAAAPLAAEPHFLLAQLAQLRGNFGQAEELLNKAIYLNARYIPAYLELAALCERAEKLSRAQTLRNAALDLIRALPGNAVIEPYETTAAEMVQWFSQWDVASTSTASYRAIRQIGLPASGTRSAATESPPEQIHTRSL